jgi:cytochrome b6-f complex iron-sulfur subunit
VDKNKPPANQLSPRQLSRRDVLVALGSTGLVGALAAAALGSLRFLAPPISQAHPAIVVAGPPASFPLASLTPLANSPVLIGRDDEGLFAISAVCTHLGCTLHATGESLTCPCHGSRFALDGPNLDGPAARPLPHLALRLNADGLLEVNLAEIVSPGARVAI